MKKLVPTTLLGVATLAVVGLIGMQTPVVAAAADEVAKREDDTPSVVLVADDDDDDTNDDTTVDTADTSISLTGQSAVTNDNTASNFTGVTNDRDQSRADLTKDFTRDGGDLTRDTSANQTNDASRNDTRAARR